MRLRNIIVSILLFCSFSTFQTKAAAIPGYELHFKIEGLKDSLCFLANYYGDKQYLKDSTKADANGNIIFKGKEDLPGGIYLFVFPNKTYFELLIDKNQHFSMECDMNNVVSSMKIKGSDDNSLFYSYLNFIQNKSKEVEPLKSERIKIADQKQKTDSIDAKIKAIDEAVSNYKVNFAKDHPGNILAAIFRASQDPVVPEIPTLPNGAKDSTFAFRYYKKHYFDTFDFADERVLRSPVYNNKLSYYVKNLIIQIPDSIIPETDSLIKKAEGNKETYKYMIWFLTNTYETSNIMGMDEVFVHLVRNNYTKEKAYWVDAATLYKIQDRADVLEPILLGKKSKNLILADTSGNYQSMYNLNGPYTILYFWDPDCGHCKKATPKVLAYYEKVKSKGVKVFAINSAVEEEKWKKYIIENKLDWTNVADLHTQNNFRHEFDISTTPQIFILDKDKKIIAKKIDEDTMEKILDNELEKKSK